MVRFKPGLSAWESSEYSNIPQHLHRRNSIAILFIDRVQEWCNREVHNQVMCYFPTITARQCSYALGASISPLLKVTILSADSCLLTQYSDSCLLLSASARLQYVHVSTAVPAAVCDAYCDVTMIDPSRLTVSVKDSETTFVNLGGIFSLFVDLFRWITLDPFYKTNNTQFFMH